MPLNRRYRAPAVACVALLAACGSPELPEPAPPQTVGATVEEASPTVAFAEVAARAGLGAFHHFNGMSGELYFAENMGSGAALFDYDGDGDLDLYLVQGRMMGSGKTLADAVAVANPPESLQELRDRLYENQGPGADGIPRFRDVTEQAGIAAFEYGMGVATGDYDGDGHVDLYISNFGPNELWRNQGDGTFEDSTATAGVSDDRWSTAATFFDYDRDGDLDLYVGNYLDFHPDRHEPCRAPSGAPDYCGPDAYEPLPDRLFRNRGDGTFEDVTEAAGLSSAVGPALGAVAADLDGDGWPDLYVANDQRPNFLWRNQGDGTFTEGALLAGASVNREGRAEASMGVDAADFDGDGDLDLFMTHLGQESNTLYLGDGAGVFRDRSFESGLALPSLPYTGFGTRGIDVENDGDLDLLVVNGSVKILEEQRRRGAAHPLAEPDQLYLNDGTGQFREAASELAPVLLEEGVSRGAAFGDIDGDGDVDAVVTSNHGPVRLLLNRLADGSSWLGLRLVGGPSGRDMLGSLVEVTLADDRVLRRRYHTDGSYLSASDPRIVIGLGRPPSKGPSVTVRWPDGSSETYSGLMTGTYTTLRQGSSTRNRERP